MRKLGTGLWVVIIGLGVVSTPGLFIFLTEEPIQKDPVEEGKSKDKNKDKNKTIIANCDVDPDKLNLKSNGKWITVYIELPKDYHVRDILLEGILLNDFLSPELKPFSIGDRDNNEILDLMIKFDRAAVIYKLEPLQLFENCVITGKLCDGMLFEGTCVIELSNL
jgi:hypothetical protein